jgi:prepilin-type processing-associated H-X9-DG protein
VSGLNADPDWVAMMQSYYPGWSVSQDWNNNFNYCYGYNGAGTADATGEPLGLGYAELSYSGPISRSPTKCLPESSVRASSDMIAIADYARLGSPYDASGIFPYWKGRPWGGLVTPVQAYHHSQGPNVLFCDGHIESGAPIIELWVGHLGQYGSHPATADETAASRWNNDHKPHRETWP